MVTYKHKFLTERAADKGTVNCASGGPGRWGLEGWIGVLRKTRWGTVGAEARGLKGLGVNSELSQIWSEVGVARFRVWKTVYTILTKWNKLSRSDEASELPQTHVQIFALSLTSMLRNLSEPEYPEDTLTVPT